MRMAEDCMEKSDFLNPKHSGLKREAFVCMANGEIEDWTRF